MKNGKALKDQIIILGDPGKQKYLSKQRYIECVMKNIEK